MPKAIATHRQIEGFCPNGHRLPKVIVKVGDEATATCRKCGKPSTFAVKRDGERLTVSTVTAP